MTNETETKTKTKLNPKIWVGCLSAYNNGYLHGEWINASQSPENIKADIQNKILKTSPVSHFGDCEEWIICDSEDFSSYTVGEYENLDELSKIAIAIEEHGEAMGIYLGRQYDIENFEDNYHGCFEDEEIFVSEQWEEGGQWEALTTAGFERWMINLEYVANNWFTSGYWSENGQDGCHIFNS